MRQMFLAKMAICALVGVVCVVGVVQFTQPAEATDEPTSTAQATLPLRWRVSHAAETAEIAGLTDFSMTMVVVMNTTGKSVSAELEWFSAPGMGGFTPLAVPKAPEVP